MSITAKTTGSGQRRYEVRLRDTTGREYSRTFKTRRDAERFEAAERADRARGTWIDPRLSAVPFSEVAWEWMASNPSKKSSTLVRDRTMLATHILPTLGSMPISQVTPVEVQKLVTRWAKTLAARTVARQYAVLRAIFCYAVDTDRIGRSPCRRIKLPAPRPVFHLLASPDQLRNIAAHIDPNSRPMVHLGAVLGLRWGEAAGLRVRDIDFEAGSITIATQRTRGPGGRMITGDPKWNSHRAMSAPQALLEVLAEHLQMRGLAASEEDATVCAGEDGQPLDYNNWRQRQWAPATRAAGMTGLRYQSLRTANATAMVALDVNVKTAQTRAGHKNVQTTLNIYARPTDEADRAAARQLGDYFLGPNGHAGHQDELPISRDPRGMDPDSVTADSSAASPDQGIRGGARWIRTTDLSIISPPVSASLLVRAL
jgi:integrase